MGVENQEKPDQKDPVVARAEAKLARIETNASEKLADLKEDKRALVEEKTELEKARAEALKTNTAKSLEEYGKLGKAIEKLTLKIDQLGVKIKRVEEKAEDKRENVLQKVEKKADDLDLRAQGIDIHDDLGDKKREEVAALVSKLEAEVDPTNATTTDARREEAAQELAKAKRQLDRLEGADRQAAKEKRAQEIREFRAKEEAKDRDQAEKTMDAELKQLPDTTPKKNEFKGMFSNMGSNAEKKIMALADKPKDPTDALGSVKFTMDKMWAQFMYAMSPKEITWDQNLPEGKKQALADAGITFVHDEEKNVSTIKFGKAAEGYEGVAPGAETVLKEYFGDNWYLKFDSLKTTDTIADLEKNIVPNSESEDDKNYQRFVLDVKAKMEADHAPADTPVLKWLAENGEQMKNIAEPVEGAPAASATPTLDVDGHAREAVVSTEEATKLAGDWGLTLTSGALLDGDKTLLKLKPGETVDISVENGGLKLIKHVEGPDQTYTGANKEAFVQALVEALPKNPITPDADAKALAVSWGVDVGSKYLTAPKGGTLLELKDGETADLKKVENNLQLTVHKEGVADRVYSASTYEGFAHLLNPAFENDNKPVEASAPQVAPTPEPAPVSKP